MKTSPAGVARIAEREGRKLVAYRDDRGVLTIGVGHTGRMSPPPVTAGMTISETQCDAMLAADLAPVEAAIKMSVKVPIGQNEFDALVSLGFNIGPTALRRSSVIKRLNQGDVAGAAQAFMLWDRPAVLEGRRAEERAQFLAPDPAGPSGVSRSEVVARARTDALLARSVKMGDDAKAVRTVGAETALAGAAGTVLAAQGSHTHLALLIGLAVMVGVVADVLFVWHRRTVAAALSANAMRASTAAPSPSTGSPASASHP